LEGKSPPVPSGPICPPFEHRPLPRGPSHRRGSSRRSIRSRAPPRRRSPVQPPRRILDPPDPNPVPHSPLTRRFFFSLEVLWSWHPSNPARSFPVATAQTTATGGAAGAGRRCMSGWSTSSGTGRSSSTTSARRCAPPPKSGRPTPGWPQTPVGFVVPFFFSKNSLPPGPDSLPCEIRAKHENN